MNNVAQIRSTTKTLAQGGSGPHDPGMEARVAKLEAGIEYIGRTLDDIRADLRSFRETTHTDLATIREKASANFRLTFTAMILGAIALAGLVMKGAGWLN